MCEDETVQDEKHFNWPGETAPDNETETSQEVPSGADVFRSWLNRAPARRRASFDPTLYTWKGYRQWKEGVSRSMNDQDD
ncbi:MAG: hypothetical protein AAFY69_08940 [Pseudomonadota bacterium]